MPSLKTQSALSGSAMLSCVPPLVATIFGETLPLDPGWRTRKLHSIHQVIYRLLALGI
jgi:hypothetical protein